MESGKSHRSADHRCQNEKSFCALRSVGSVGATGGLSALFGSQLHHYSQEQVYCLTPDSWSSTNHRQLPCLWRLFLQCHSEHICTNKILGAFDLSLEDAVMIFHMVTEKFSSCSAGVHTQPRSVPYARVGRGKCTGHESF